MNISKIGKRGSISRFFRAKNDGDTITAWRLKLREILQVFNVRSVPFSLTPPTTRFQAELAINTHVAASDTQVAVLGTQVAVLDTRNIALEIQRTMVEHVAGGRKPLVNNYFALSVNDWILTIT